MCCQVPAACAGGVRGLPGGDQPKADLRHLQQGHAPHDPRPQVPPPPPPPPHLLFFGYLFNIRISSSLLSPFLHPISSFLLFFTFPLICPSPPHLPPGRSRSLCPQPWWSSTCSPRTGATPPLPPPPHPPSSPLLSSPPLLCSSSPTLLSSPILPSSPLLLITSPPPPGSPRTCSPTTCSAPGR